MITELNLHDEPECNCDECQRRELSESTLIGLLACPFCGEKRINHMRGDVGNLHWGFCTCCRTEGPVAMSWDAAKELWNTRKGKPGCKEWDEDEQECMDCGEAGQGEAIWLKIRRAPKAHRTAGPR